MEQELTSAPGQTPAVGRLAEAIRDLRLLEQPPAMEFSLEGWVRAFIRQMRVDDGLPLDRGLLDELTGHSRVPYSAGPFSRGEVQGRPEDKELLEGMLGEARRVLIHAGAQLGLVPEQSLEKLKWESLERFERYLYAARDAEGDLLLRDVPVETMSRWFYRQIPQRLIPAVADREISRTDLARALGNPFRLANEQGNQVTADLIRRFLADGAAIDGRRLTGDPAELAKDPSLIIPWIRLQMAANLVDYSNSKILEAIAAEKGNNDAEKLAGYLRKQLETPFAWGSYNERDLAAYVRSVLQARRPEGGYVEEVVFGDNNAQLVATLKLIEAKLSYSPLLRVRLVLKGDNGVMNDASVEDGEALLRAEPEFYRLLLQYRRDGRFGILAGPRSHGTPLDLVSEEVARALLGADAVFSEGEANAVMLNGLRGNLYLSLRLKAPLFVRHVIGVDPEELKDYPPAFLAVRGGRYYDRVLASSGPEGGRATIEDHWARPNHVRLRIRPMDRVFGQLPSGEEMEIYIRNGKSSGQSRVVATAPIGWVHYRGRSLREGAVGQYTLQKTEKILEIKEREIRENHQEPYERLVDIASQGIFFLPLSSVRDLLGRRASMREWRMAAPYVFRFIHRLPDGSAEVELRYREPVQVVANPAAGAEEEARKDSAWEPRYGSWSPITSVLNKFDPAVRRVLMEKIDQLLKPMSNEVGTLEESTLSLTQRYGIPVMMSALLSQFQNNPEIAAKRIGLVLDWVQGVGPQLPDGMDLDEVFHETLRYEVPEASQKASTPKGFIESLRALEPRMRNQGPGGIKAGAEERLRVRETDGLTWKDTGEIASGLEEYLEPGGRALVLPADQPGILALAVSPGIREIQTSVVDAGIEVRRVPDPETSRGVLLHEPVNLLLVTPEDAVRGDWRGESGVPTVILPAAVAAGLEHRDLSVLAAAARAHGGILPINDLTRSGAEEQSSFIVLRMT